MRMMTEINNAMDPNHEFSIAELDFVAGGVATLRGFLHAVVDGAKTGASIGMSTGGINAAATAVTGAAVGAAAGGIAYLAHQAT